MAYSTGQVAGATTLGSRSTLTLTAPAGGDAETVSRLPSQPQVTAEAGISTSWDPEHGELLISARHDGQARARVSVEGREIVVLAVDRASFARVWQSETAEGTVRSVGPDLVRSAVRDGRTVALRGDTDEARTLVVDAPEGVDALTWNGAAVPARRDALGALVAQLPRPAPAADVSVTGWSGQDSDPERLPGFDASGWTPLTKTSSPNLLYGPGLAQRIVMTGEDYGFDHGDLWYRGTFTPWSGGTTATISVRTGNQGMAMVWINGRYLGAQGDGPKIYAMPWDTFTPGTPATISVLVRNNGHPVDPAALSMAKHGRGLWDVALHGSGPITWSMQGRSAAGRPPTPRAAPTTTADCTANARAGTCPGRRPPASLPSPTWPRRDRACAGTAPPPS